MNSVPSTNHSSHDAVRPLPKMSPEMYSSDILRRDSDAPHLRPLANIYDYIDKVVYINLDYRTDRREHIEKEFEKYGIHTYERFPAIKHDVGIVGCTKSHQAVYKLAKENGYRNILIFEDDFKFTVEPSEFCEFIQHMCKPLSSDQPSPESSPTWDVCLLCYSAQELEKCEEPYKVRILEASAACGYIVNGHYYDKLIELYNTGIPLLEQTGFHWLYANDQYWKQLQKTDQWYGGFPRIGKQIAGYSDNGKCFMSNDDW